LKAAAKLVLDAVEAGFVVVQAENAGALGF
jgi:hypothetical protein